MLKIDNLDDQLIIHCLQNEACVDSKTFYQLRCKIYFVFEFTNRANKNSFIEN